MSKACSRRTRRLPLRRAVARPEL